MLWIGFYIILSLPGLLCSEPEAQIDIFQLLPPVSAEEEWTWGDEPVTHNPEDLFEYLNGGAPQYLSYGFVSLLHSRYVFRNRDLESVTLDIYDMGSSLGAYGIYSSGRPRGISFKNWGVEGYRSGTVAAAWKGRIYVHTSADEDTPVLIDKLEAVMEHVMKAVPGESSWPPAELSALPERGRVYGSERYIGKNLLGHSFLPGGFLANYESESGEGLLFLSHLGSADKAREAFDLFRLFESERGELLRKGEFGDSSFWAEDPGLGEGVVVLKKAYVLGLWGIDDVQRTESIVEELEENLLSRSATE